MAKYVVVYKDPNATMGLPKDKVVADSYRDEGEFIVFYRKNRNQADVYKVYSAARSEVRNILRED